MEKRPYNFRITNENKIDKVEIISLVFFILIFCALMFFPIGKTIVHGINLNLIIFSFFVFLISFPFPYLSFNTFKINIVEMILSNDNILTIKFYFLKKLKNVSFDMNTLQFRIEPTLYNEQELVIHNNNYKRLFKVRGANGMTVKDLENIIISFRNAGIKELERKGLDKKTFYDSLKIIKVNYLSKDLFRNFWYV